MSDPSNSSRVAHFGVFEVDLRTGELRKRGVKLKPQEKPLEILAALLEHPGQVVTREELHQKLWPADTFVDFDNSLNAAVNKLREILGDSAQNPIYVETLPRRGYRFLAPVESPGRGASPGEKRAETLGKRWAGAPLWKFGSAVLVVAVVLAVGIAYFFGVRVTPKSDPAAGKVMLAVLPFQSLSDDPEQKYFCGGLTEEMIAQLGQINPQRLGVIARTTSMVYKDSNKPIDQIGQELGVDYVLEGSVRREGDRLRITAQLIQVSDQAHLWAESYDRTLASAIGIQSEVSSRVAQTLIGELLPERQPELNRSETTSPAAYEAYLKGRYFRELVTERGFRKGIEYFSQAVEIDPGYASGYSGLAGCYCLLGGHGMELEHPPKVMPDAKAAALKALELDETKAEAHAVVSMIRLKYDWDWSGAEKGFKRALEINPSYAQAHLWYSLYFEVTGRAEEAIAEAKRARDLDPLSLRTNVNLASQLYQAHRYDEAIEQLEKTMELDPNFWVAHWVLGDAYIQKAMYPQATRELQKALALSDRNLAVLASLGYNYAVSGRKAEARETIKELKTLSKDRYVSPFNVAIIWTGLGQEEQAFQWLEKGYEARSRSMIWLKVDNRFDSLGSDPRFQDLLNRIGFPSETGQL